jgi:hypothetical protein
MGSGTWIGVASNHPPRDFFGPDAAPLWHDRPATFCGWNANLESRFAISRLQEPDDGRCFHPNP